MSTHPVGDWLARRYPPNRGATHWMGSGDDPGCCAGPHPACLYSAAWREALRSLAADLDDEAANIELLAAEEPFAMSVIGSRAKSDPPTAARMLRRAAHLAREKAGASP